MGAYAPAEALQHDEERLLGLGEVLRSAEDHRGEPRLVDLLIVADGGDWVRIHCRTARRFTVRETGCLCSRSQRASAASGAEKSGDKCVAAVVLMPMSNASLYVSGSQQQKAMVIGWCGSSCFTNA